MKMTKYEALQSLEDAAVRVLNEDNVNNVKQIKDYIKALKIKRFSMTLDESRRAATDKWFREFRKELRSQASF